MDETLAKFDWSVVYVPGKDNTVADCLSCWAYPARKAWMDISMRGDTAETAEAKRIIEAKRLLEEGEAKCFVVMGSCAELAQARDAKVQAVEAPMKEEDLVLAIEGVQSFLMEDWSDDYANSGHWLKYSNVVSAPSEDDWPVGLTEDGDKIFFKDKLLVPGNRVEDLIDHWHNGQLMHSGRAKLQKDLESRPTTKHPNRSTAGSPVYRAIPESPMRLISMEYLCDAGSHRGRRGL